MWWSSNKAISAVHLQFVLLVPLSPSSYLLYASGHWPTWMLLMTFLASCFQLGFPMEGHWQRLEWEWEIEVYSPCFCLCQCQGFAAGCILLAKPTTPVWMPRPCSNPLWVPSMHFRSSSGEISCFLPQGIVWPPVSFHAFYPEVCKLHILSVPSISSWYPNTQVVFVSVFQLLGIGAVVFKISFSPI